MVWSLPSGGPGDRVGEDGVKVKRMQALEPEAWVQILALLLTSQYLSLSFLICEMEMMIKVLPLQSLQKLTLWSSWYVPGRVLGVC